MFSSVSLASLVISGIPAGAMLLGSALALVFTLPIKIQALLQNLSAGVILAAVGKELFPMMNHNGIFKDLGVVAGFTVAMCFMFGLQKLESVLEGGNPNGEVEAGCGNENATTTTQQNGSSSTPTPPSSSQKGPPLDLRSFQVAPIPARTAAAAAFEPSGIGDLTSEEMDNPKLPVYVLDALNASTGSIQAGNSADQSYPTVTTTVAATTSATATAAGDVESGKDDDSPLDLTQKEHLLGHLDNLQSSIVGLKTYLSSENVVAGKVDHDYIHSLQKLTTHIHEDVHVLRMPRRAFGTSDRSRSISKLHPEPAELTSGIVPITLIIAVTIDAMVDGFLIGVSYAALPGAGYAMALATCIEMGLLGITFSADLKPTVRPKWLHVLIAAVPPGALTLSGYLGGLLGMALEQSPILFVCMIAFGVVALLFLVTQELLIQAHNNQEGKEIWWINMWLFVGVLLGILIDFD